MADDLDAKAVNRLRRSREWLEEVSNGVLGHGLDLATESDRWFLTAIRGVSHGARQARHGFGALARATLEASARLRPAWARARLPHQRIRDLLEREAKRLQIDVSTEDFSEFADRMSTFLELVFTGAIQLDDVCFEAAPDGESGELTEEVAEQEQHDEDPEREPLSSTEGCVDVAPNELRAVPHQ